MASQQPSTQKRDLHVSPVRGKSDEEFQSAKARLNSLKSDPGNDVKLQLYGLYKQATEGKCQKPKPGMMDVVGKAKWQAWKSLGDMSQDTAKGSYVDLVNRLEAKEASAGARSGLGGYETMRVTTVDGVCTICLNRPARKNAITHPMYEEWIRALEEATKDPAVQVVMMIGAGDYYCSGNDLSNFANFTDDIEKATRQAHALLLRFVATVIDFPKTLVAALNGPAVGISVTMLAMCDAVFAAENVTLQTPFSNLGQTPECCSSFTFPTIMGPARANALIMFNEKITAQEAYERGLVTRVLPRENFRERVSEIVSQYAKLPPETLLQAKSLIRSANREKLHQVNRAECDQLVHRWTSSECLNAVAQFFQRKAKL